MIVKTKHHQSFSDLPLKRPASDDNFRIDFLGVIQRKAYDSGLHSEQPAAVDLNIPIPRALLKQESVGTENRDDVLPLFNEEYFEWVDIVESAKLARSRFIMIELGAGYARWICAAAAVLRSLNPIPHQLIAVEAEPTHFRYLKQHLSDNNLLNSSATLIQAAVADHPGLVKFHIGNPTAWYGQAIAHEIPDRQEKVQFWLNKLRLAKSKPLEGKDTTVSLVKAITLNSILKSLPYVDLVDLDVQGAELAVLSASVDMVNRKVKRLHIGTHSSEIESGLRDLFGGCGWKLVNDYPCLTKAVSTPFGVIDFQDGVQTWLNPRFNR